jgi:Zn-dependent protease with chaperone function
MTRQAFETLLRKIENRYQGRQSALEHATTLWIAFGLAVLLSWLVLITSSGVLCFAFGAIADPPFSVILIILGISLAIYGILQTRFLLRVELAPPEGYLLVSDKNSPIGSMLDGLRSDLQCRPFDEIRISLALNAAVYELPRLGLLGWSKTVLEIGYPLACVMSPEELKAILAHELVHISERHGLRSGRIGRLNRRWGNLFQGMQKPAGSRFTRMTRSAIVKFVDWYWPRLHARSLVLSRLQEFQADREASKIAGNRAIATSLWRLEGLNPWLSERFWPEIHARISEWPEPPVDIAVRLREALQTPPPAEDATLWTDRALVRATLPDETHPAFLDRAQALGLTADDLRRIGFLNAARPSAAETLLGDVVPAIETELSESWRKANRGSWRDRYRRAASMARRQGTTTTVISTSDLVQAPSNSVQSLWETACDVVNLQGFAPALPLLKQVLERDSSHDGASVILGRHLAVAGDPEGEAMLNRVLLGEHENWIPRACEALQEVYRASGRLDRLREIHARLDRHESDVKAAQVERSRITASDAFLPHGLDEDQLAPLRELLASMPTLGTAWLVRKKLQHFPSRPLFVLCVRATDTGWWASNDDRESDLKRRLIPKVELPGQVLVIVRQGSFRALAQKCMKAPEGLVYRRNPPAR